MTDLVMIMLIFMATYFRDWPEEREGWVIVRVDWAGVEVDM